ncbi:MAG: hypothetical protein LUP94_00420 [Candidatus Methanomethylicus sp.]|nr:hypothetical protein [Candidatus Methanomethylicus sp.]
MPPIQAADIPKGKSTSEDQEYVSVTVYNSNMGLVRDIRAIEIPSGTSELQFMDVAQRIDPTTVHIKSLTAPESFQILEQSYEFDLLNPQKLLDKYVGRELTLLLRRMENNTEQLEPRRAILLSNNSGQVWRILDQIVINPTNIAEIRFDELPRDLIAQPTLVWTLMNTGGGNAILRQRLEASYITEDLNWRSDYVLVVNRDDTVADLNGWVTIANRSGATYRDAELKLVAGDVKREREDMDGMQGREMAMMAKAAPQQFEEESFFEYHLYSLQRRTTLKNSQTKQVCLLSASGFPVAKELAINGLQHYFRTFNTPGEPIKEKVGIFIVFRNAQGNGLGTPLPKGIIRVYKADQSGSQQFIGEDRIDHTPKDEELRINVGNAFDIVAERRLTDYKQLAKRVFEYAYEIRIRNHKEENIRVLINEAIGGDWEMISSNVTAEKTAAFAARFVLPVEKGTEAVLNYRVRIRY